MNKGWQMLGGIIGFCVVAILAPIISPNAMLQNLNQVLQPPFSSLYWLGTNELGQDVFGLLLRGLGISMLVGMVSTIISAGIGVPLGLIAGWRRGHLEQLILRASEVQMALPTMLLALVTLKILGAGLENLIVIIGVFGWASFARYTRATVLVQRELEYMQAATALGVTETRALWRHLLPNIASGMLLQMALDVPHNILLEASLSFLGVGVGIETPSLGSMVSRGYGYLLSGAWWLSILPGGLIMLLVLQINALSEILRVQFSAHRR